MQDVEILVRRGDGQQVAYRITASVPPEHVWAVLADVSQHLEWGGERQTRFARLTSIDGPDHELRPGDRFTSSGVELGERWSDTSTVLEADPPHLLVFQTDGVMRPPRGRALSSRWRHRYEIAPVQGGGSRIRYVLTRVRTDPPPLPLRIWPLEGLMFRAGKRAARRGLRQLVRLAGERAR